MIVGVAPRSSFPKDIVSIQGQCQGSTWFKDILKGKNEASVKSEQTLNILGPYIMEWMDKVQELRVDLPIQGPIQGSHLQI